MNQPKPVGYWLEFDNIASALQPLIEKLGRFPIGREINEAGMWYVLVVIYEHHNGLNAVRARMGYPAVQVTQGYWSEFSVVENALRPIVKSLGHFPTKEDFARLGEGALLGAIQAHHGGLRSVARRLGYEPTQVESGYWAHFPNLEAELRRIAEQLGHFPTETELRKMKKGSLCVSAVTHHGGMRAVRARMGYTPIRSDRTDLKDFSVVESLLLPVIERLGRFPTGTEMEQLELAYLMKAIYQYHHGMVAVCRKMGCDPVSDLHIAHHADALANIVPSLGVDNDRLWKVMKSRWMKRDLEQGIEEYTATGTYGRFEQLLAG